MRSRTEAIANDLLERVAWLGEMGLIRDFALPLPMTIITEILGVPAKDHDKFHRWFEAVVSLTSPTPTLRVMPGVWKFIRYLRQFFKLRRRDPQNDLVSALIAGHETAVNLIGNGTLAFIENPIEMTKLRSEPALVKLAVEELLRYTSPVLMTTERYALENALVHGVTIPRGEMTLGVIGSGNRDESVFENPNELQITREPNKHLAFGQGIHFCLGAPLARMEAQIAFTTILRRLPKLRLKIPLILCAGDQVYSYED